MSDPYDFFATPRAAPADGSAPATPPPASAPMGGSPARFGSPQGFGAPPAGYGTPAPPAGYGTPAPGFGAAPPGYGTPQGPGGYPGNPYGAALQRPGMVTAVAVLIFIGAGFLGLFALGAFAIGAMASGQSDPNGYLAGIGSLVFVIGVVLAAACALYVWVGRLVLKGNYVAMIVVTAFNGLSAAVGLADLAGGDGSGGGLNIALSGLIIGLLWNSKSKAWFASKR